jgi:TPP-dependent pyruvate/acetoin dehydrogenase alpha subunit
MPRPRPRKDRGPAASPATPPLAPADVGLSDDGARELYRLMALTRALDERMWTLNRQGKAPFVTPARGHEAVQVASARRRR